MQYGAKIDEEEYLERMNTMEMKKQQNYSKTDVCKSIEYACCTVRSDRSVHTEYEWS